MPEISIIIPTRKRNHLLPRALRSLYAQSFDDFEIILIDDNPKETSVQGDGRLLPLLQDPRLRILKNPNPRNAAAARNAGLRVARGEWVTYLDDDDEYLPAKLKLQLDTARKSGLPMGLCSVTYQLGGRKRTRRVPEELRSGKNLLFAFHALPALFHRRTRSILFNENLDAGEDAYYFLHLVTHFELHRIFYVDEVLVLVHPQPGLRVNTNAEAAWKASLAIYSDFGGAYEGLQQRLFLTRARLQYFKFAPGDRKEILKLCLLLLKLNGTKEIRLILNTVLYKVKWLRRFLVS